MKKKKIAFYVVTTYYRTQVWSKKREKLVWVWKRENGLPFKFTTMKLLKYSISCFIKLDQKAGKDCKYAIRKEFRYVNCI